MNNITKWRKEDVSGDRQESSSSNLRKSEFHCKLYCRSWRKSRSSLQHFSQRLALSHCSKIRRSVWIRWICHWFNLTCKGLLFDSHVGTELLNTFIVPAIIDRWARTPEMLVELDALYCPYCCSLHSRRNILHFRLNFALKCLQHGAIKLLLLAILSGSRPFYPYAEQPK